MSILKSLFNRIFHQKTCRCPIFSFLNKKWEKSNLFSQDYKRILDERYQIQSQAILNLTKSGVFNQADLNLAIQSILETGCKVLNTDRGSFWLFQEGKDVLECILVYDARIQETRKEPHKLYQKTIPNYFQMILEERVVVSNDVLKDEISKEFLETYSKKISLGSLLDAPIRLGGDVVGVLSMEVLEKSRNWCSDEVFFCGLLADYVALAIVSNQRIQSEEQNRKLREIYNERIHQEKLNSMARFVFGIAHEINNPIGAIQASLDLIRTEKKSLFGSEHEFTLFLTREEKSIVEDFFLQSIQTKFIPTGLERKKLKDSIQKELEKYSIPQASLLAEKCVDAGIYHFPDKYREILSHSKAPIILEFLIQNIMIEKSFTTIENSIQRVANIIQGLKKYFHEEPKNRKILTSIEETLETTLILFYNKLKHGVEVIRNYEKVDMIYCYPDELIQMWANLIQNALQAMEYKGILEVHLKESETKEFIQVDIIDNGKGIPQEIQDRIFEPFFTTKELGQGTGIGLDICRKIIQFHNGKISFQSQPGRTVFTVLLPKTINP